MCWFSAVCRCCFGNVAFVWGLFVVDFGFCLAEGVEQGDEALEMRCLMVCFQCFFAFPGLAYHHYFGTGDGLEEVVAFASGIFEGCFNQLVGYHSDFCAVAFTYGHEYVKTYHLCVCFLFGANLYVFCGLSK